MTEYKEETSSNMEEEKQKPSNGVNGGYSYFDNMLQRPYECFEEVIRVIFRCLGFQQDSPLSQSSTATDTTTTETVTAIAAADSTCISTTTTIVESVEEDQKSCPTQENPDLSNNNDGGGGDGDSIGAESTPVNTGKFPRMAIRKPSKPPISTGRGPQNN